MAVSRGIVFFSAEREKRAFVWLWLWSLSKNTTVSLRIAKDNENESSPLDAQDTWTFPTTFSTAQHLVVLGMFSYGITTLMPITQDLECPQMVWSTGRG